MELELNSNGQNFAKEVRDGDAQAFRQLFDLYCKRIRAFALSYLADENDADELVQVVFVKVWENRSRIDISKNIKSFLFQIAVNSVYDVFREKKKKMVYVDYIISQHEEWLDSTWGDVVFGELDRKVDELLLKIPSQRREIFVLSRMHGLSYKDIANKYNISTRTVENQIYRTMVFLKSNLIKYDYISALLLFLVL